MTLCVKLKHWRSLQPVGLSSLISASAPLRAEPGGGGGRRRRPRFPVAPCSLAAVLVLHRRVGPRLFGPTSSADGWGEGPGVLEPGGRRERRATRCAPGAKRPERATSPSPPCLSFLVRGRSRSPAGCFSSEETARDRVGFPAWAGASVPRTGNFSRSWGTQARQDPGSCWISISISYSHDG